MGNNHTRQTTPLAVQLQPVRGAREGRLLGQKKGGRPRAGEPEERKGSADPGAEKPAAETEAAPK